MEKRIKELVSLLNKYRNDYYNDDHSEIDDQEYDALFDELTRLEQESGIILSNSPTQTVGYEVKSKLPKVTHSHPMLSLDKTKDVNDLVKFAAGHDCILSLKLDGVTSLITLEGGKMIQAETRGNGEIGELITHNAKVFENLPVSIPYTDRIEFEGESIILQHDFEAINAKIMDEDKKYKNPRNLVSGSVRQLDSRIAKERHINFMVWKVPEGFKTFTEGFDFAKKMGFDVVPYRFLPADKYLSTYIQEVVDELRDEAKQKGIPIDGLVCSYNDVEYGKSLGRTGHHPRHSIALKAKEDSEQTTLLNVEWGIGKTGQLTPVAVFEPIELAGTTVERASLHNISIMKQLGISIGAELSVIKANEIIPMVTDCDGEFDENVVPDFCPYCGEFTQVVKDNDSEVLMCTNEDCTGRFIKLVAHACSRNALNIDGMSEATIEFCVKNGWIKSLADIYELHLYKKKWSSYSGFGAKSVEKILAAIEKSRNTDLQRFLYALSIPNVGQTASKEINKICNGDAEYFFGHLAEVRNKLINTPGYGSAIGTSLKDYFNQHEKDALDLAEKLVFKKKETVAAGNSCAGKTFVITGSVTKFKNRKELQQYIEDRGGKVSGSVSKTTDFLINNDTESNSSKNIAAKKNGVQIISEDQFLELFN